MSIIKVDYGEVGGGSEPIYDDSIVMGNTITVLSTDIKATDAHFVVAYFRFDANYVYPVIAKLENGAITSKENQIIDLSIVNGLLTFTSNSTTITNGKTLYVTIY